MLACMRAYVFFFFFFFFLPTIAITLDRTHFSSFSLLSSPYFSTPFSLRLPHMGRVQERQRLASSFSSARSSSASFFVSLRGVSP